MADNLPKTYEELTGTNSGTYEEALASARIRNGDGSMEPKPDTPTGAAVHVNTATDPAPEYVATQRPEPVPVINDPGLIGARPSLAELNAAARASYGVPEADQTSGMTEDANRAAIKEAAEERQKRLLDEAKDSAKSAVSSAKADAKGGSKVGSASSKA